jgi:hypothetical protein
MSSLGNFLGYKRISGCYYFSWAPSMQRTLSEHVARLEEKIVALKRQLRADDLPAYSRAECELDLANTEQALGLFLRAYELEQKTLK